MNNSENKPTKKVWETPKVILIDVRAPLTKMHPSVHENTGIQVTDFFLTQPDGSAGFLGTIKSAIS